MNTSIFHRALTLAILVLILPLYAQLDDIGITIDSKTRLTVRDSLGYLIYEGESPLFNQVSDGGAIDFYGEKVESIRFRLFHQSGTYKTI